MSTIAIIGHPASGYQQVEATLHQHGMAQAQPSRRDGLSPLQITATLCQAHKTVPLGAVADEEEIRQIDAGTVWHGLALDLMLGNLNQALWGWADPQAIYTLNYWSALDPQMRFVLVYDEPHRVLIEAARAADLHPSADSLRHQLDNWAAYNGALLRFYLRHPERCLLVHARQTQQSTGHCLRQLQDLLDTRLTLPTGEEQDQAQPLIENADPGAAASGAAAVVLSQITQAGKIKLEDISAAVNTTATERYLADGVLAGYPKAAQLYAELQSAASLPLNKATRIAVNAASAWETWVRQRAFVFDLVSSIHTQYRATNDALVAAHQQVQDKSAALADLQRQIEHKQAESAQENGLLLSQLHQVQEELERHHLENQRLKDTQQRATNDALAAARKQVEDKNAALAATQKQVQDKTEALTTAQKQAQDKAAALANLQRQIEHKQAERDQENDLLLSQLHQVQEELERYYLENQRLKETQQRATNDALAAARKQVENKNAALAELQRQIEHKQAESLKENQLLQAQLQQTQQELERSSQENQQLKNPPKPPGPLGAADRIRKQLTYRLGAVMVSHNTLGGWLTLPWALTAETRAFRRERRATGNTKLPPIHTYLDAANADTVKQHLSYRLGDVFIKNTKSPLKWFTLPFALRREVREFRRTSKAATK